MFAFTKIFIVILLLAILNKNNAIDCSLFNPNKIKLITFDVFAALMQTETSLLLSTKKILPSLTIMKYLNL